jgi:hypothetical protein
MGVFLFSRKDGETQSGIESSPLRLSCFARFTFFKSPPQREIYFFARKDAEVQREFFAPFLLCEIIFFSRGSKRKNNADKALGKQKICGSFLLDQRKISSRLPKQSFASWRLCESYFFFSFRPPRRKIISFF